jgi:hypothetical protein
MEWATLLLLALVTTTGRVHAQSSCARPTHALAGFTADLHMRSRQVRGTVTVVDACSFDVTRLEVRSLFISRAHGRGQPHPVGVLRPAWLVEGTRGELESGRRVKLTSTDKIDRSVTCSWAERDVCGLRGCGNYAMPQVSAGSELQWRGAQGDTDAEVAAGTVVVAAAVQGNVSSHTDTLQASLLQDVFWDDFAVLALFSPRTGLTAAVLSLQVRSTSHPTAFLALWGSHNQHTLRKRCRETSCDTGSGRHTSLWGRLSPTTLGTPGGTVSVKKIKCVAASTRIDSDSAWMAARHGRGHCTAWRGGQPAHHVRQLSAAQPGRSSAVVREGRRGGVRAGGAGGRRYHHVVRSQRPGTRTPTSLCPPSPLPLSPASPRQPLVHPSPSPVGGSCSDRLPTRLSRCAHPYHRPSLPEH